ncbi:hypothetical protein DL93DRAFT_2089644, partial [Clavulina sp. PMI_390]
MPHMPVHLFRPPAPENLLSGLGFPLNFLASQLLCMYTSQNHDVNSISRYQRVSLHFIKSYRY